MALYHTHVFINCPFDETYRTLFDAAVFTVHDAGFVARCSREISDTSHNRLAVIMKIIGQCRYGLHDLSRTQLNRRGLPRFNMPLEFGIYLGCKCFGGKIHSKKSCLVLDTKLYRYQEFISDIAGQDIAAHADDPRQLVRQVRDWLRTALKRKNIPKGSEIWSRFKHFRRELPAICKRLHINPNEIIFADYANVVVEWLRANPV